MPPQACTTQRSTAVVRWLSSCLRTAPIVILRTRKSARPPPAGPSTAATITFSICCVDSYIYEEDRNDEKDPPHLDYSCSLCSNDTACLPTSGTSPGSRGEDPGSTYACP